MTSAVGPRAERGLMEQGKEGLRSARQLERTRVDRRLVGAYSATQQGHTRLVDTVCDDNERQEVRTAHRSPD
jgi:hypothetical protein